MPRLFIAPDGDGEPSLWMGRTHDDRPEQLLRRCDLPWQHRPFLWSLIEGLAE